MSWFQANAPIRTKLLIAFGLFVGMIAGVISADALLPSAVARGADVAVVILAVICAAWFREVIAGPYVATVVRMEALAAGDLGSGPINGIPLAAGM